MDVLSLDNTVTNMTPRRLNRSASNCISSNTSPVSMPSVLVKKLPNKSSNLQNKSSTSTNTSSTSTTSTTTTTKTRVLALMEEYSSQTNLVRLGEARPEAFSSLWKEIGFVFSLSMSQILSEYFISGFTIILPTLTKDLDIPTSSRTWPASAFSMFVAAFLLIFGRYTDMYGGYRIYIFGMLWLGFWSLIASFSEDALMLDFCRALQGIGPAAFLSSGMMLLGCTYRPGTRKNFVLGVYGACAPFGFFIGIFFAGIAGEYSPWSTYFWGGCGLSLITAVTTYFTVPSDAAERREMGIKMDWWGAGLTAAALFFITFAIIDSSHAPRGWGTWYIILTLILGIGLLIAALYVEFCIVKDPLLPWSFFKVPNMIAFVVALFFTYGSLGIYLLYATFYMEEMMKATPFQLVGWFSPMAIGGVATSYFSSKFLHRASNTWFLIASGTCWIISPLLFALAPDNANYWSYVFPAMICATIGIDITFNVANIYVTTNVPRRQQGLAGAVLMWLMHAGIAVCLGWADVVNTYSMKSGKVDQKESWKRVFYLEVCFATFALVVIVMFIRVKKAESELTVEEREAAEADSGTGIELQNMGPRAEGVLAGQV